MESSFALPIWFWPIAVPVLWAASLELLSAVGGWRKLAEAYPSLQPIAGKRFLFQSAQLRYSVGYNGCLTITADVRGLFVSILLPLRIGHPDFFVPWDEISSEPGGSRWSPTLRLRFSRCPAVPLVITKRLASRLESASGRRIPGQMGA
jgi:hypothetical protein